MRLSPHAENRHYLDDCPRLAADPRSLYEQSNADTRRLTTNCSSASSTSKRHPKAAHPRPTIRCGLN